MGRWKAMPATSLPLTGLFGVVLVYDPIIVLTLSWLVFAAIAVLGGSIAGLTWAWCRKANCFEDGHVVAKDYSAD